MRFALALLLLASCGEPSMVRTATLTSDVFALPGPGLRLADGAILAEGMGDVFLAQRSTATMRVASPLGICDTGTFASLSAAPTTLAACIGSAPTSESILSSNQNGTNQWTGRAWLIFDDVDSDTPTPLYRMRAVSDADDNPHIVLTIEYEPL